MYSSMYLIKCNCYLGVVGNKYVQAGSWDSINIIDVKEVSPTKAVYKLTTTIILGMGVNKSEVGDTNLSGTLTRQVCILGFTFRRLYI